MYIITLSFVSISIVSANLLRLSFFLSFCFCNRLRKKTWKINCRHCHIKSGSLMHKLLSDFAPNRGGTEQKKEKRKGTKRETIECC